MQSRAKVYRVRRMYLNADLDAIYEPVLHFLWVLMTKPINSYIKAYVLWAKKNSVLLTQPPKNIIWLPKSAKTGHFVSLP